MVSLSASATLIGFTHPHPSTGALILAQAEIKVIVTKSVQMGRDFSDPLKRELSIWIRITREIWGVPSDKVGGYPRVGLQCWEVEGGPGRLSGEFCRWFIAVFECLASTYVPPQCHQAGFWQCMSHLET